MRISELSLVSSYSDTEAVVIGDVVYSISSHNRNASRISEDGIYMFDLNHTSVSTPDSDVERMDVVIINETVAYIGERNSRIMLPLSGGVALSFAGKCMDIVSALSVGQKVKTVHFDTAQFPRNHVRINGIAYDIQKFDTVRALFVKQAVLQDRFLRALSLAVCNKGLVLARIVI